MAFLNKKKECDIMESEKVEKKKLVEEVEKDPIEVRQLAIESIVSDPCQPRSDFDKNKLEELADSIKKFGVIQPILVSPIDSGQYRIVHGERRYRACVLLGMRKIPAQVKEISEQKIAEIQLVENVQRENLNPIEEAECYKRLMEKFGYTHEQIAEIISKSREYVTNKSRLLDLPKDLQTGVRKGNLSEGHARALLSLNSADLQRRACREIAQEKLNVRETESLVKNLKGDVSHETSDISPMVGGMLVSVPLDTYRTVTSISKKMRVKPHELIQKAMEYYCKNFLELSLDESKGE